MGKYSKTFDFNIFRFDMAAYYNCGFTCQNVWLGLSLLAVKKFEKVHICKY